MRTESSEKTQRPKREKTRPYEQIEKSLIMLWTDLYKLGKKKWKIIGKDELKEIDDESFENYILSDSEETRQCYAYIITKKRKYKGNYIDAEWHAEMNALYKYNENMEMKNTEKINKIIISSPPCNKCAVVLESLGLSEYVYYPKGKKSRNAISANFPTYPEDFFEKMIEIITRGSDITKNELHKYERNIFSTFLNDTKWSKK